MLTRNSSRSVLALLSLSLVFAGCAVTNAATYPPKPGVLLPPAPGHSAPVIKAEPSIEGGKVFIPSATESHIVLRLTIFSPTKKNIATLHTPPLVAVKVRSGLVMGGVGPRAGVAQVLVKSKGNLISEIQAPKGLPVQISVAGFVSGHKVDVTVSQKGSKVDLGNFIVSANGSLTMPASTLIGNSTETFNFIGSSSAGDSIDFGVDFRPVIPIGDIFSHLIVKTITPNN